VAPEIGLLQRTRLQTTDTLLTTAQIHHSCMTTIFSYRRKNVEKKD